LARRPKHIPLLDRQTSPLSRELVEAEARRLGVLQRQRKVDLPALVLSLALGFQVGTRRSLESLRHAYQKASGQTLVRSSFYARFSGALAELLSHLSVLVMKELAETAPLPRAWLRGFAEVLATDATVIRLHRLLARPYAGCRTNHTKAAAKLHLVMRVLDAAPTKVRISPERMDDRTPWRKVGPWLRDRLLLMDLGYYSFHLFARIDDNGGYFLSRLKANANPVIDRALRRWRGQSIPIEGRKLKELLRPMQRQVLDAEVTLRFQKRVYRGRHRTGRRAFRLVALYNKEKRRYHCYLTNLPPEQMPAEHVGQLYTLRWQVELFIKALKHHGHLDQLPSRKKAVVDCLLWAAILATCLSQRLLRQVRAVIGEDRAIPMLRWAALFSRVAEDLLRLWLRPDRRRARELRRLLLHDAPDPNRHRRDRALDPLEGRREP
jgi:IS4 transposase